MARFVTVVSESVLNGVSENAQYRSIYSSDDICLFEDKETGRQSLEVFGEPVLEEGGEEDVLRQPVLLTLEGEDVELWKLLKCYEPVVRGHPGYLGVAIFVSLVFVALAFVQCVALGAILWQQGFFYGLITYFQWLLFCVLVTLLEAIGFFWIRKVLMRGYGCLRTLIWVGRRIKNKADRQKYRSLFRKIKSVSSREHAWTASVVAIFI